MNSPGASDCVAGGSVWTGGAGFVALLEESDGRIIFPNQKHDVTIKAVMNSVAKNEGDFGFVGLGTPQFGQTFA
jgi:hypothetical protein